MGKFKSELKNLGLDLLRGFRLGLGAPQKLEKRSKPKKVIRRR